MGLMGFEPTLFLIFSQAQSQVMLQTLYEWDGRGDLHPSLRVTILYATITPLPT